MHFLTEKITISANHHPTCDDSIYNFNEKLCGTGDGLLRLEKLAEALVT